MSCLYLVIVSVLIIACSKPWSVVHAAKKKHDHSQIPAPSHSDLKEDWETKGKILYANEIIHSTTESPYAIATTIDEINDDDNEVNVTVFTLIPISITDRITFSTCHESVELTTELTTISVVSEPSPQSPEIASKDTSHETNKDVSQTKTRISYRPTGSLSRNNTYKKPKRHGPFSKPLKKVKGSNDQQDTNKAVSLKENSHREIRSLHPTEKTNKSNEFLSKAMKQLYSTLMKENIDPNKKKRENEENSDKSCNFMSEGFWETPMTQIIGTGVEDVKVQFARPLVNNLNSLNETDSDKIVDNQDEPLQIVSNDDNGENVNFIEDGKNVPVHKSGYYKPSSNKLGDFDVEKLMSWSNKFDEGNKKVYNSDHSKKSLQKWGKLAGKLQPIWDAVNQEKVEVTTGARSNLEDLFNPCSGNLLPLNETGKYKNQQFFNYGTVDSMKNSNGRYQMNFKSNGFQPNEKSQGWGGKFESKNTMEGPDLMWELPDMQRASTKSVDLSNDNEDVREKFNEFNQSKWFLNVQRPFSNDNFQQFETNELTSLMPKASQSKWESPETQNQLNEFSNSQYASAELQKLMKLQNSMKNSKTNKMQELGARSKWGPFQYHGPHRKWDNSNFKTPTMSEFQSKWDKYNVNKPNIFPPNGNNEYGYNKFIKEHPSKWEMPQLQDSSPNESRVQFDSSDVQIPQENALHWRLDKNPLLKEYKQKWSSPVDEQLYSNEQPPIWQTSNLQNPSKSQNQMPFVDDLSATWKDLQNPSNDLTSKWQKPVYHNPSADIHSFKWDQSNSYNPTGPQSKCEKVNLQTSGNKDSETAGLRNPILNDLSIRPNLEHSMPQNYSQRESNFQSSSPIEVSNMKWDSVNSQMCSLSDESPPVNELNSKEVDKTYLKSTQGHEPLPGPIQKGEISIITKPQEKNVQFDNEKNFMNLNPELSNPIKDSINFEQKSLSSHIPLNEEQNAKYENDFPSITGEDNKGEKLNSLISQIELQKSHLINRLSNFANISEPTNISSLWDYPNNWKNVCKVNSQSILSETQNNREDKNKLNYYEDNYKYNASAHESNLNLKQQISPYSIPELVNSTNYFEPDSKFNVNSDQLLHQRSDELLKGFESQNFQNPTPNENIMNGWQTQPLYPFSRQFNFLKGATIDLSQEANPLTFTLNNNLLSGQQMDTISFDRSSQINVPELKLKDLSNQFNENSQIITDNSNKPFQDSIKNNAQNKWKSENIQNPSLRDIQRQWDTANYVSNPITAESQLHWEHNSLEGELDPQEKVPDIQNLEPKLEDTSKLKDKQSGTKQEESEDEINKQNASSDSVKLSKLHARTTSIENRKPQIVSLENQTVVLPDINLGINQSINQAVKIAEQISPNDKLAVTNLTQIKSDTIEQNSSITDIVGKDKSNNFIENSLLQVKTGNGNKENRSIKKIKIKETDKNQNAIEDEKQNSPDEANFVENSLEYDQKEKDVKSIRSRERQYSGRNSNKKSKFKTGINVDVNEIVVKDSPLTNDITDCQDEINYEQPKNREWKKQRNKSKVIHSRVRSHLTNPSKKNMKYLRQNLRNRIVSKTKKRKMVPPINITIAMKNLFNRVSPADVSFRNSSSLDPDGSFKFSIELKDKLAQAYKRSVSNETIV